MKSNRLLQVMGLVLMAVPLAAQNYQSSFSGIQFDKGRGAHFQHGGVDVNAASGAVSMSIPLGSGIGARGAHFTPTMNAHWEPQGKTVLNHIPWMDNPFAMEMQGIYTASGGVSGLLRPHLDLTPQGGINFPGGDSVGIRTLGAMTDPSLSDTELASLIAIFAPPGATALKPMMYDLMGGTSGSSALHSHGVTERGDLIIYLTTQDDTSNSGFQRPGWIYNNGTLPTGSEPAALLWPPRYVNYPKSILVISANGGESAYYYTFRATNYTPTPVYQPDPITGEPMPGTTLANAAFAATGPSYLLTAILNRFGDKIIFNSIQDMPANNLSYQAEWRNNNSSLGSVEVKQSITDPTVWKISYPNMNITYKFTTITADLNAQRGSNIELDLSNQILPEDLNKPYEAALPDALTLSSGDVLQWHYLGGEAFVYKVGLPGGDIGGFVPKLLDSIDLPGRTVKLTWARYLYRMVDSSSFLDPGGVLPGWFWGAESFSETDTASGKVRTTQYKRNVPIPTEWVNPSGVPYPNYNHPSLTSYGWSNTNFNATVTLPDGSKKYLEFVEPSQTQPLSDDEKMRCLAYLKHQLVRETLSKADGTKFLVTQYDRFDVRRLFNSSGNLDLSARLYPTRVQTADYDLGTLTISEQQGWDDSKYGWTKSLSRVSSGVALQSMEFLSLARVGQASQDYGAAKIQRTSTYTYDIDLSRWLVGRVKTEKTVRDKDTTGDLMGALGTESYLSRSFLSGFNTIASQTYGDSDPQVTLTYTLGSSGLAAANPSQVTLSSQYSLGTNLSGSVGAGYLYDEQGFLSRITPLGVPWYYKQSQDCFGQPTSQTNPNDFTTGFVWDSLGRLKTITPPFPSIPTGISYPSLFKAVVTRQAQSETYNYNGFGQLSSIDRNGYTKTFTYDLNNRLTFESVWGKPEVGTTRVYDHRGRLTLVKDPNGITTTTTYSGLQWTNTTGTSIGIFTQDAAGQLASVNDGISSVAYKYNLQGKLVQAVQTGNVYGGTQTRTWAYNSLGWPTSLTQPENGTTTYSNFYVFGKPKTTNYAGHVVNTTFDSLGRAWDVSAADGSVSQHFQFDGGKYFYGKLQYAKDYVGGVRLDYTYTGLNGLLDSITTTLDPILGTTFPTFTQTFGYDNYGFQTRAVLPNGHVSTHAHAEALGVAKNVGYAYNSVDPGLLAAKITGFNENSLPTSIWYGSGAFTVLSYGADQTRLATLAHNSNLPGPSLKSWTYHYYDANSGLLKDDTEDSYTYDNVGRLLTATVLGLPDSTTGLRSPINQTFKYDDFGNRTSSTFQPAVPPNLNSALVPATFTATEPFWPKNRLPATANGAATGSHYTDQGFLDRIFKRLGDSSSSMNLTYDALGQVLISEDMERNAVEMYGYAPNGLRTVVEYYKSSVLQKIRFNIYNDQRQLVSQYDWLPDASNPPTLMMRLGGVSAPKLAFRNGGAK